MIERIFIKTKSGGAIEERRSVRVIAGAGIEGDRYFNRHDEPGQNITLVQAEAIEGFQSANGRPLDLSVTGRNLVTRGVELNELVGKEFRIGAVRLKGVELCDPCLTLGQALCSEHLAPAAVVKHFVKRGGLRADVLSSGELSVGARLESAAGPFARAPCRRQPLSSNIGLRNAPHLWRMKALGTLALAAVSLGSPPGAHAQEFGWFAQVVGSCWKGAFPDGTTVHRQCYTLQFERFIRGTAELLSRREGKEVVVFQGDSLFAWNAPAETIEYYIWGTDGSHYQLSARYVNDELHFPVPSRQDPGKVAVRSVWKRLSESSFEVRRERVSGQGWNTELRVVYHREG